MVDFRVSGTASIDPDKIIEDVDMILEKLDEFKAKIDEIDLALDNLSHKGVDIEITIHGEDKIILLRDLLDEIDHRIYHVDIEVNLKDVDKLIELKTMADELDAKKHNFNMKVNLDGAVKATTELKALDEELNSKEKDMKKASNASKDFQFSMLALLPLFTALIPVIASAAGGIVALAGAFAVMAPAMLGIFLAVKPAYTAIQNLTKSLNQNTINALANAHSYKQIYDILNKNSSQFRGMTGELQDLTVKWFELKNAYTAFQDAVAPSVFPMLGQGMELLKEILSGLPALVRPAAAALQNWLTDFSRRLKDPTFQAFFHDMKSNMYQLVTDWTTGLLNILEGLAGLFHAFMPLTMDISGGFLHMTQSFDKWAQGLAKSKGFQQFVDYVKQNGPMILHIIGQAVQIIFRFLASLSGMGHGALSLIDKAVTSINHLASTNPKIFALAANLGIVGVAAWKLAPALGPIIEFLATPVGAVVGVLIAAGAAFVYLYTHSKKFHDWVNANLLPLWHQLVQAGQQFATWAKGLWGPIQEIWHKYGKQIEDMVKLDFDFIVRIIKAALKIIEGIVDIFLGLLSGHWSQVWKGIKELFSGIWNAIVAIVVDGLKTLKDEFEIGFKLVGGLVSDGWRIIKNLFNDGKNAVVTMMKQVWHDVVSLVEQWMTDVLNVLLTMWTRIDSFFGGWPSRILSAIGNVGNILYNIGVQIINGLLGGLKSAWNTAASWLSNIAGWISNLKGPIEKDRNLLIPHGHAIMDGFLEGLQDRMSPLEAKLRGVAKTIENTFGKQYATDISTKVSAALNDASFATSSFNRGGSLPSAQPNQVTFAAGAIQVYNAKPEQPGITLTRVLQGASRFGTIQAPIGYSTQTG